MAVRCVAQNIHTEFPGAECAPLQREWEARFANTVNPIDGNAPVAHYELDGSFSDISGHYRNGRTVAGDPTFETGQIGRAATFDGDAEVSFGNVGGFERTEPFSVAVWVKGRGSLPMAGLQKFAGADKLQADVDEFYLGRVQVGQTASADIEGRTYRLKVAKVYPQVRNGQFQIDLLFVGPEPQSMQRGQTVQAKLTLGDSSKALLIPNGAFFNDTGGNWVFVVDKGGNSATKRAVQLGRRNSDFIEVLGGLKPGEKVITSSYSGLVDKDHLTFSTGD